MDKGGCWDRQHPPPGMKAFGSKKAFSRKLCMKALDPSVRFCSDLAVIFSRKRQLPHTPTPSHESVRLQENFQPQRVHGGR